jgi:hypothetical protein
VLIDLVTERGFHRGESLPAKLDAILERLRGPS